MMNGRTIEIYLLSRTDSRETGLDAIHGAMDDCIGILVHSSNFEFVFGR